MEEMLQHLEIKIKELINHHHSLKYFNQQLHQGKHAIVREKEVLLENQQHAISQVELLIAKLREATL